MNKSFDKVYVGFELLGKNGNYYWRSTSSGVFGWGTFKTKKEAREKMEKHLNSF